MAKPASGLPRIIVRAGPARIQICGRQLVDGPMRQWIAMHTRHLDPLDAPATRKLPAVLTDAADEIERLS